MTRNILRFVCAMGLLTSGITPVLGGVALEDTFNYVDAAAMIAEGWVDGGPGAPAVESTYFLTGAGSNFISTNPANQPAVVPNQTVTRLNNAVIYKDLPITITEDWTVTANVAINGYSRAVQIGLGDAITGAGYSLQWNAAQPQQNAGHGFFAFEAQDDWSVHNPIESNNPGTINLVPLVPSGSLTMKAAFPTGFALPDPIFFDEDPGEGVINKVDYSPEDVFLGYTEIKLSWSPETNVLEAHINNAQIPDEETLVAIFDFDTLGLTPFYTSFSRLYISGGTNSFVDYVKVESSQFIPDLNDPGDFDDDGDVDGRDFLLWQRGESYSGPLDSGDLLAWQENYGAVSGLAALAAVPEPSSVILIVVSASLWCATKRRVGR